MMLCSNTVSEEGPSDWRPDGQYNSLVSPIPQLNKGRGYSGERLADLCQGLPAWGPRHPILACILTWGSLREFSLTDASTKPIKAGAAACGVCEIKGVGAGSQPSPTYKFPLLPRPPCHVEKRREEHSVLTQTPHICPSSKSSRNLQPRGHCHECFKGPPSGHW